MKIFKREFWGTVLIVLGVLIFLAVIYDSVRPYFPSRPPYRFTEKIRDFFQARWIKAISHSRPAPARPATQPPSRPPPVAAPPPLFRNGEDMLTKNIHQTKGRYNLWVWEVKPEYKTGDKVKVEIAHAAAGEKGGFQIVAYADTDSDGEPDNEIARSEFLTSEQPGAWSSFEFSTPEKTIFVGNTWPAESDTWVFRGDGIWPLQDSPFDGRFYHTIRPGKTVSAGPSFTNMRITFSD
jgi:hypothetical protein